MSKWDRIENEITPLFNESWHYIRHDIEEATNLRARLSKVDWDWLIGTVCIPMRTVYV